MTAIPRAGHSLTLSIGTKHSSFNRRGMTLLEIAVVVAIIGLLSVSAVTRYGFSTLAKIDAQGFAQRIALDCSYARRLAIATGYNHLLRFTLAGGNATQYNVCRNQAGTVTAIDEVRVVPDDVTVTTGGLTDIEFTFVGEGLSSYTITVQAPDRTWTITVPQVTGKAFIQ